jgi:uncharacterized membrane protein YgcG
MTIAVEQPASASLATAKHSALDFLLSTMQSPFTTQQQPGMQSGQFGNQSMQQVQGQMTGGLERMRDWLQNWIQNTADTLRVYVNQYPPLAAFLFTLLVLSAVPVSVYVVFALVTSAIFLTIALVSFSLVEGFILLTSGGILMAILGGIGLFTTIGFAVVSSIYLGYRGFSFLASNVWQAGGQIGGQMKEAAQRMQQPGGYQSGQGGSSGLGGISGSVGASGGATSS